MIRKSLPRGGGGADDDFGDPARSFPTEPFDSAGSEAVFPVTGATRDPTYLAERSLGEDVRRGRIRGEQPVAEASPFIADSPAEPLLMIPIEPTTAVRAGDAGPAARSCGSSSVAEPVGSADVRKPLTYVAEVGPP